MKKSLFLLPLLALGLVACGGTTSSGTSTPASESTGPASTEVSASTEASASTEVSESTQPEPGNLIATYDFTGLTGVGAEITDPQATLGSLGEAITWTSASKVYDGNYSGGAFANGTAGMLKFGTGGAQGVLAFTVNESVAKVVLNCHSFYANNNPEHPTNTTNFVSVNEMTPVAAPYNETAAGEDVTFELATPGSEITIKSCNPDGTGAGRIYLFSLSLYR